MSTYATKQTFGGRRACVGDAVVIAAPRHDGKEGACLCAGVVHAVSTSDDVPYVARVGNRSADPDPESHLRTAHGARVSEPTKRLTFFSAPSKSEVEAMPLGHWAWRPAAGR